MMGWLFVGFVLFSIQTFSLLSMARSMKRWSYVIEEHSRHLAALNNVNNIHQQHLGLLSRKINDG